MPDNLKAHDFLGQAVTQDYVPHAYGLYYSTAYRFPIFRRYVVRDMLRDARIRFALRTIKGPITAYGRMFVDCKNAQVKQFLVSNLTRFWRNSVDRALRSLEWGYSCSEVIYRMKDGLVQFDTIRDLESADCQALTYKGEIVGATIKNTPNVKRKTIISGPKCLWCINDRHVNPFYGASRCEGAYLPWIEKWTDGGFRDQRRLFFHKYAYDGGDYYYPVGSTQTSGFNPGETPLYTSNRDLIREIAEKRKTGGISFFPSKVAEKTGQRDWERTPPTVQPPPVGVLDYGHDLDDEELIGMGVPPEILQADGTGAYAGREIPHINFFTAEQQVLQWMITDFDRCVLKPLILYNFGYVESEGYEIVPYPLLEELAKAQEGGQGDEDPQGEANDPKDGDGDGVVNEGEPNEGLKEELSYKSYDNKSGKKSAKKPAKKKPKNKKPELVRT